MQEKILFMIYKNEIKLMKSENVDHWKWYQILGGNPNEYDNLVRGYIVDNKIIFFKSNYTYDEEVIDNAKKYGPLIKKHLNIENAEVYCGIERGEDASFKPRRLITNQEMDNYEFILAKQEKERQEKIKADEQMKILQQRSTENDIIEFKNDYSDESFSKYAVTFTTIILAVTLISKIFLISTNKLYIDNRWNSLIVIMQIACLVASIYFYKKKSYLAKYTSLLATIFLFITFNLPDIIIATFNLFFTVDQKYIIKFVENVNKAKKEIKKTANNMNKKNNTSNKK